MLVTRAALQKGEWVLVWGIGGGVATAAFRIAQALGARTIVTSSSDEKLAKAAELGADVTVNHATGDVVAAVKEATGGGADVVVETVGEATWKRSLDAARAAGRVVVCGATSGPNPPAALHRVWWKQLDILGSSMGNAGRLRGRIRPRRGRREAGDRHGVSARRGAGRARAARGRRAVREDPARHPRLAPGLGFGASRSPG